MKQKNSMSKEEFKKLSLKDRGVVVSKMAKRLNSRLTYLEETKNFNRAYETARIWNEDRGRLENRYSQSKVYNTLSEVNTVFNHLSEMLDKMNTSSTNIVRNTTNIIKSKINSGENISISDFNSLNAREQAIALRELARENNKQLNKFNRNNRTNNSIEVTKRDILELGQKNGKFYTGLKKYDDETFRQKALRSLISFKNNRFTDYEKSKEIEHKTLNTFREKGLNITDNMKDDFFSFLSSQQFKKLGSKMSSNQVVETFVEALNENIELDEIKKEWGKFLNGSKSYKEVRKHFKGLKK